MAKDAASGNRPRGGDKKASGSAPVPVWRLNVYVQPPQLGSGGGAPGSFSPHTEPAPERRSFVTRALAELVPGLTRAVYRRRSPAGALLMSEWAAIVGPRLSMETAPKRFVGGTLTIACSGAMAMELQHLSAALIERINGHAGQVLVQRLRFVQEPVAPPSVPVKRRVVAPVPLTELPPGELNDALARLRAAIRTK